MYGSGCGIGMTQTITLVLLRLIQKVHLQGQHVREEVETGAVRLGTFVYLSVSVMTQQLHSTT